MTNEPDVEKEYARLMLWTKLSTYSLIEVLLIGMNSENEEVEVWALNSLREFGKLLTKQMAEPGYKTGVQHAIEIMARL